MIDVEDADARSADFISDLQSMIDSASAVGVDVPLADHTELRRWLAPRTVRRFAALWPPWRSRGPSALRRFGVAVQLMLMVQRAAVVLFALLSLSSVAALRENLKAHTEAGGQRARARILPRTRERARAQRIHPPPAAAAGDVDWDFGAQHNEYDDPPTYELYIATTTGYGMESVDVDAIRLQNYLGIVQVFVLILFLLWIRRVMRYVSWRTDVHTVTASDYTVMISGLRAKRDVQVNAYSANSYRVISANITCDLGVFTHDRPLPHESIGMNRRDAHRFSRRRRARRCVSSPPPRSASLPKKLRRYA